MRLWPVLLFAFLLALCFGIAVPDALATETDQFTLPPEPLDDLGPDLGAMVLDILHSELAQLNAAIDQRIEFNPKAASEPIKEREFVTHIFEQTGVGLPESTVERALRYGSFAGRNVRFKPAYADSIYAWVAAPFPLSHMMTDCPTIRLYGVDQGTDKIGHVFQQGYEYLTRYEDALAGGADEASALAGRSPVWRPDGEGALRHIAHRRVLERRSRRQLRGIQVLSQPVPRGEDRRSNPPSDPAPRRRALDDRPDAATTPTC